LARNSTNIFVDDNFVAKNAEGVRGMFLSSRFESKHVKPILSNPTCCYKSCSPQALEIYCHKLRRLSFTYHQSKQLAIDVDTNTTYRDDETWTGGLVS